MALGRGNVPTDSENQWASIIFVILLSIAGDRMAYFGAVRASVWRLNSLRGSIGRVEGQNACHGYLCSFSGLSEYNLRAKKRQIYPHYTPSQI